MGVTTGGSILVVAGTHGNERNAAWLLEQWQGDAATLNTQGLPLVFERGNPAALQACRRYIDRDLNRSFAPELLSDPAQQDLEVCRARELLARHGPQGAVPAQVVFDLHSTTAAMGNSLVVYGRRAADLALAAGMQQRLGLPIYLHEADGAQTGFLVERWPCGLVVEVGPVPQGVIQATICRQTQLALEAGLEVLAQARAGALTLPRQLAVHRHLGSVDLPRSQGGSPAALLHPALQGADWRPLGLHDAVMLKASGGPICLGEVLPPALAGQARYWPVFVNEAAYDEKGIAFALTRREEWSVHHGWCEALQVQALGL